MDLFESLKRNLTTRAYAQFSGRASRAEFWWFVLGTTLLSLAVGTIDAVLRTSLLSSLFSIFLIVPNLAISARRLHDTNRSGWYMLLALIPIAGWIVLLVFYATRGEAKKNQYGAVSK